MVKPLKWALWVSAALFFLVALAMGIAWWRIDGVAQAIVESGATQATGQPAKTDAVHVSIFNGNIGVKKMALQNVEGYSAEQVLHIKSIGVSVELASLWTDTLRVEEIEITGLEVYIEQKGFKNNVSELLEQIQKAAAQTPADARAKKLQIDRVVFKDIIAHVQILPIGGKATSVKVMVPELVLEEVTPDEAQAVVVAEVIQRIIPAVIAAVLEEGQGILPDDLIVGIGKDLAGTVGALGEGAGKLVHQAADDLGKTVLKDVPGAIGHTVEEGLKGVGEGLKGVFDRKKE